MPSVQSIGTRIFAHLMAYPPGRYPLVERGHTTEIDWPFRTGRSIVARIPFTRQAISIGTWGTPIPEEDALMQAVGARWMDRDA